MDFNEIPVGSRQANEFDQWYTTCPKCDGALIVRTATLEATGETIDVNELLQADGFLVPSDERDCSTSDELVECLDCHAMFTLDEVSIENDTPDNCFGEMVERLDDSDDESLAIESPHDVATWKECDKCGQDYPADFRLNHCIAHKGGTLIIKSRVA
jgi:hypothetical protein